MPLALERQPYVAAAIADLDADIVFLQEIWTPDAVVEVRDATSDAFPLAVFPEPVVDSEVGEPSCTIDELADLQACIAQNCAEASPDELVGCVLANCGAELADLDEDCQTCIAANVGNTVEEAIGNCTTASSAFAYGGSVGIGLLSKAVILDTDVLVLESSVNRRAVLHVLVDAEDFGPIHVFGTHLTALLPAVPYPGDGTWEEEQARQIEAMLAYIDSRAEPGDAVVLLGDFNTGPAGDLFQAEAPTNYAALASAMDTNAYVEMQGAGCTYCGDNPLRGDESSVVIDHVLTRDLDATGEAQRVLDGPLVIEADGETVTTALSDHYGVLLTLTRQ